jgi:CheY-like chemotaxis protein
MADNDIRVVLIGANAHIRRLIATVLQAVPVGQVIEARSTTAAMPLMESGNPHLVIMDWTDDPTEGLLFVHRLRRGELGRANTPVMALYDSLHHAVLEQASEAGIDEVIAKPISAIEVITCSANLIELGRRNQGTSRRAAE